MFFGLLFCIFSTFDTNMFVVKKKKLNYTDND